MPAMPLPQLRDFLREHLLESIVPFWMEHAIDERGGINTCIADDGAIQSYDKLLWSQLRAVYTFSALYNRIEPRQEWLDVATRIVAFCAKHGRDERGRWIFRVDREGIVVEGPTSIYVDGFALQGLSEYLRAVDDPAAKQLALDTFANVEQRLAQPGSYASAPYDIPPGLKAHGISMIFSYGYHGLAQATGDAQVAAAARRLADEVMDDFRRPDLRQLREFVRLDATLDDSPIGRCIVPGHAIESMWFQLEQYRSLGLDDRVRQCVECMRWHIDLSWDREFGGMLLGIDAQGKEPVYWKFHDTKLWWPHTEAIVGLLLAYEAVREDWCLDWYWKVHDVAFEHYPVPEHGEWTQKLDRRFNKIDTVVALPVKDPFHLPRALILSIEALERMTA